MSFVDIEITDMKKVNFSLIELALYFVEVELNRGAPYFRLHEINKPDVSYCFKCLAKPGAMESFFDWVDGKISQSPVNKIGACVLLTAITYGVSENFLQEYALKGAYSDYCKHQDSGANPSDFNMRERINKINQHFTPALQNKEKFVEKLLNAIDDDSLKEKIS